MKTREISEFQRGILTGMSIGTIVDRTYVLFLFMIIMLYDIGRIEIVNIGRKSIDKFLNKFEQGHRSPVIVATPHAEVIADFQRGLMTGVAIGVITGVIPVMLMYMCIILFDMGTPRIINISQIAYNKLISAVDDVNERVELEIHHDPPPLGDTIKRSNQLPQLPNILPLPRTSPILPQTLGELGMNIANQLVSHNKFKDE